ncbi:MAG: trypsin-like serine protease [Richelia sp. RM2_1_2]|nr:trypsin-like serine protease [Richelia sp. SM1_7_0]NJN11036.1 trypsin-like serine protease [Richelia sp. RM1_1_1]NJO30572.1 trypsin-like serine protease [Richelia sp. SL_2_1]NJO62089.1 trypsin-like serine protease [Richelia sp. RM2_1_2]
MMNKRLSRLSILTLCTVFALTGISTVEQILSLNGREAGYSNRAIAQTASEQIARSVYQKASPAVVTVKDGRGHGSGFVVSQDGLIITNAHVVEGSPSVVTVVFADGKQLPADVIGFAKGGLDLAVLKIHNQKNLPTLALATPGSAEVGDRVFGLGTPLESKLNDTFTQGDINRIDRKDGRIQHDTVIQGGNSGGPLLNTKGQVIGVNTSGYGTLNSGTNFAIPVSDVRSFLAAARKGDLSSVSTLEKSQPPTTQAISLNGQVINGSLAQGDFTPSSIQQYFPDINLASSFVDSYQFQAKEGQKVVIEMTSKQINPSLTLYQVIETNEGQQHKKIAENDDRGAGDFNSRITAILPTDGVYYLFASSPYQETGDYSLRAVANP